ncbi:MAG: hypothetical protein PeribacterA2_0368 [Candidatus Peribacter riflensis]|uniref:Uncharacterized protein n=1 Tax=Candidatus Peribacter riflensis TaxID=1735162 RepID=A0A0S1SRG8_9BACT|nr:MAG: hypothetical protein PeribacterA2_0368 [Candidatus Peribacter riflensis]OGJ78323.1 MAG: hypothetical protein A2398_05605 [Candidatus Peribacteria bacterium RIFOXYB1_FULL_57_12]OGJ81123.1 MAG: hypothetical protein A2412_04785 [Candidatus Peribacteria bacterium RIFOXYC1_FULL_58_8]ALM10860.1 MAG: hypothetical protein PeribacterB2_0368 [Candidatus Peribacter riflensis]ALM11962.1 MAG: hypothetical protein PeribacterC2_0367 [Candidatus Peribacter riflensis]
METIRAIAGLPRVLRRPTFLAEIFAADFLPWALWEQPKRIIRAYAAYAAAFMDILSIPFLLKTLLSPWKGIAEQMPSAFQWDKFLQAFFVNLVTRMIGMVIRLLAIVLSLAIQMLLFALFIVIFVGWFVFPLIVVGVLAFIFILV